MLEKTGLDEDPKCLVAYVFYNIVKEEILNRIPLHVRCAWESLLDNLSPDLIRFIQNSAGETEDPEKWIGINKFIHKTCKVICVPRKILMGLKVLCDSWVFFETSNILCAGCCTATCYNKKNN